MQGAAVFRPGQRRGGEGGHPSRKDAGESTRKRSCELSACNTASASGAPRAEPLSGLARAFLYAGTRALLVTHWQVDSQAAVELVTATFAERRRAEALRRSMSALIERGDARAHPSYWAPFVVAGDAAR